MIKEMSLFMLVMVFFLLNREGGALQYMGQVPQAWKSLLSEQT